MDTSINSSAETMTPMRGMELVTRNSIHSLGAPSITSNSISLGNDDNIWKLTDLRVISLLPIQMIIFN